MEKNMEETWMFYMGEYREFGGQHKHRYHVQVWLGYPIQKIYEDSRDHDVERHSGFYTVNVQGLRDTTSSVLNNNL